MARVLILSVMLLGAALVAGCATSSTAAKTSTPERRLADVLTTQHDADAAYHAGNLDTAATLYLQLTKLIPQEANYWYLLGNTYVRMQQPDLAVQAYQQAIMRHPKHARAWHNLGIVRMRQAEAAFVSSASTATVADPMHDVSSHLADALATIGKSDPAIEKSSADAAAKTVAIPLPAPTLPPAESFPTSPPAITITKGTPAAPAGSSVPNVSPSAKGALPVRPDGQNQP